MRKKASAWAQRYISNLLRESLRTKVITEPCLIIYMAESFLLSQILHQQVLTWVEVSSIWMLVGLILWLRRYDPNIFLSLEGILLLLSTLRY